LDEESDNFKKAMAKAEQVLGSYADAESWMNEPKIDFNWRRPKDIVEMDGGLEVVLRLLGGRAEHKDE
jgi:uncharacterized protein (DUF2384 family)